MHPILAKKQNIFQGFLSRQKYDHHEPGHIKLKLSGYIGDFRRLPLIEVHHFLKEIPSWLEIKTFYKPRKRFR